MGKAKAYFIKEIIKENVVKLYVLLGKKLTGKVAVKVHSVEEGNQNYLHPEFMKEIVKHVNVIVVECNTAYDDEAKYTGGTIIFNGETTNTITNQMMGDPGGMGGNRGYGRMR